MTKGLGGLSGSSSLRSPEPVPVSAHSGDDPGRVDEVIAKLTAPDRDLILGNCNGWGSWMWDSGSFMVSLGLGTKRPGSIQFDTPLAKAVIARLKEASQ